MVPSVPIAGALQTRRTTKAEFNMSEERTIEVSHIALSEVLQHDKVRYNTNNNYADDNRPSDYDAVVDGTITSKWIDMFKSYRKIELDLKGVSRSWVKNAYKMGMFTGIFPKTFEDERDCLANEIESAHSDIFDGTEYFIRTENVSFKCGQHGVGPYRRMKEILESLVTCKDGHTPVNSRTTSVTLYFIPWVTLSPHREYRGFVCNNSLTAISQQQLYKVYESSHPDNPRHDAAIILHYFETVMKRDITFLANYTFDIAVLEDDTPYFIEMNCFGTEYAAGSALFGWEQDHDQLYGAHPETLFVRVTC
jgi:hypothetical protein